MTNVGAGGEGELCQIGMGFGKQKMDGRNNTSTRITTGVKKRLLTPLIPFASLKRGLWWFLLDKSGRSG